MESGFFSKPDKLSEQFLRYVFVGFAATIVDVLALYVLTEYASVHYLVSAIFAFVAGLLTNYSLSRLFVFPSSFGFYREFITFSVIGIGGVLITELTLSILSGWLGIWYMASKAAAVIFTLLWNFFMRRRYSFGIPLNTPNPH